MAERGWDGGREGGRAEEGRIKGAGRELEWRKVGGGMRNEGGREDRGRRDGAGEAGGRTKVGVRELEGRKLGGGRKGEGIREQGEGV